MTIVTAADAFQIAWLNDKHPGWHTVELGRNHMESNPPLVWLYAHFVDRGPGFDPNSMLWDAVLLETNNYLFAFKQSDHAVLFKLRWGNA